MSGSAAMLASLSCTPPRGRSPCYALQRPPLGIGMLGGTSSSGVQTGRNKLLPGQKDDEEAYRRAQRRNQLAEKIGFVLRKRPVWPTSFLGSPSLIASEKHTSRMSRYRCSIANMRIGYVKNGRAEQQARDCLEALSGQ
jgi:hypothetical protein